MTAANVISAILDRKDLVGSNKREDQNNLSLADQFQFSSLLKVYVTPPEKEIEKAQGKADPLAANVNPAPKAPSAPKSDPPKQADPPPPTKKNSQPSQSTENSQPKVRFDPAKAKQDLSRSSNGNNADKPKQSDAPKDNSKVDASAKGNEQPQAPKTDNEDFKVATIAQNSKTPVLNQAAPASKTDPVPAPVTKTEDMPKATPPSAPKPHVDPGQANAIKAALPDTNAASKIKLPDPNAKPNADSGTAKSTAGADHASLAAKQADDLSQKLGLGAQPNQVSVKVQTTPANNAPAPTNLAPQAVLADAGGRNNDTQGFSGNQGKPDGSHLDTAQKVDSRGAPPPNANALGQTVLQGDFQNAGQAIRAQAFAAGAQNAAPAADMAAKAQTSVVEPTPLSGVATVGNTNPLGETAKTTPAQPPRPPVPVRSPAEQIAIQIQKGLGAGADKISIKLHPENLGRVEVKLEVTKDGHLAASISADKPHTLDLLKQDSRILERALQEAGLQTNSDSLSFSLSGNGSNQTLPEDRSAGNAQLAAGDANLANLPIDNVVAPNVAYGVNVASDGGVDITV